MTTKISDIEIILQTDFMRLGKLINIHLMFIHGIKINVIKMFSTIF